MLHMYIWCLPLTLKLQFQRKFSELLRAKSGLSCGAIVSCDGIFASFTLVWGRHNPHPQHELDSEKDEAIIPTVSVLFSTTHAAVYILSLSTHITPELPTCPQWLWRPNMTWEGSSCCGESRPEQWLTATDNVRKQRGTQSVHPGWVTVTTVPPALQYEDQLISCCVPWYQ